MSNVTTTPVLTASVVTAIGRAEGRKQTTAADVILAMPAEYDWTARGAIAAAIRTAGGWTVESCPARKTGPKGDQKVTVFGVGFQSLEDSIRTLVKAPSAPEPGVIRISLSGEGGATVTLREGDRGYAAARKMLDALAPADADDAADAADAA